LQNGHGDKINTSPLCSYLKIDRPRSLPRSTACKSFLEGSTSTTGNKSQDIKRQETQGGTYIPVYSLCITYYKRLIFLCFASCREPDKEHSTSIIQFKLATSWTARVSNPVGGDIFSTHPHEPWGPFRSCTIGTRFLPRE
jgi:hypothetical protein